MLEGVACGCGGHSWSVEFITRGFATCDGFGVSLVIAVAMRDVFQCRVPAIVYSLSNSKSSFTSNRLKYENARPEVISKSSQDEKIYQICKKLQKQNLAKIYLFTEDKNLQLKALNRNDGINIFQQTNLYDKLIIANGKLQTTNFFLKRDSIFLFDFRIEKCKYLFFKPQKTAIFKI